MATATRPEPEPADPGRAELYLRLQVEAELRRGLGMPRYQPPRPRLFPDRVPGAVVTMLQARRRAAMMRRLRQARIGGPPGGPGSRFRRITARNARRVLQRPFGWLARDRPAGAWLARQWPAWRHWFRLHPWRATRRRRHRRGEPEQAPSVDLALQRVVALGAALTAIGTISEETESELIECFQTALAVRGLTEPQSILGHGPHLRARATQHSMPGPLRAWQVGVVADTELDGQATRIYLGALVADANSAMLTVRMRYQAVSMERARTHVHAMLHSLHNLSATDNLGASYQAHFSGGGSPGQWDGRFRFSPPPPAAARWLDLSLPGAAAPVRVPLDTPLKALTVSSRPVDPADAADRYLDIRTVEQLQTVRHTADEDAGNWPGVFRLAADLIAAGVLTARSPSVARMAAVCERLGRRRPEPLSRVKAGAVPAEWLGLLPGAASSDAPTGLIPVATALPAVDGVHCVVTDLLSEPESVSVQVYARGWPVPHRHGIGYIGHAELFHWTARDDLGGWYTMGESGGSYSDGEADMDLRLFPPVNPRARELEIILTGRTEEASVTVPLDWQPVPVSLERQ